MKRLFAAPFRTLLTFFIVVASLVLMNGCSRCSHDEVPPPPVTPPPAEDSVLPAVPTDLESPGDADPAGATDQDSSSPNESVD